MLPEGSPQSSSPRPRTFALILIIVIMPFNYIVSTPYSAATR